MRYRLTRRMQQVLTARLDAYTSQGIVVFFVCLYRHRSLTIIIISSIIVIVVVFADVVVILLLFASDRIRGIEAPNGSQRIIQTLCSVVLYVIIRVEASDRDRDGLNDRVEMNMSILHTRNKHVQRTAYTVRLSIYAGHRSDRSRRTVLLFAHRPRAPCNES